MSSSSPQRRFEPAAHVLAAAKTRLPLRLPRPEETGPQHRLDRQHVILAKSSPSGDRGQLARPRPLQRAATAPSMKTGLVENRVAEKLSALPPTDEQLEARAQQALFRTGILSFSQLRVEVRKQRAVIYGSLDHDFELPLALQTVRRVKGIEKVTHRVRINVEAAAEPSPPALSAVLRRNSTGRLMQAVRAVLTSWFRRRFPAVPSAQAPADGCRPLKDTRAI